LYKVFVLQFSYRQNGERRDLHGKKSQINGEGYEPPDLKANESNNIWFITEVEWHQANLDAVKRCKIGPGSYE
jgi:hypothetical protein